MDSKIVKKMNEIIGILKIIERELAGRTSLFDKQKLINERREAIETNMQELEILMAEIFSDDIAIRYYQQLKEEVNRILNVGMHPLHKYL